MRVYSKHAHTVYNADDAAAPFANQLFTDGASTPSEFVGNPYNVGDMVGATRPACEADMSCVYCSDTDVGCTATAVPEDFVGENSNADGGNDNGGGDNGGGDDGGDDGDDNSGGDAGGDEAGCTPLALPGQTYGHTLTVTNYVADWAGTYCSSDVWNGAVHYRRDDTHHLYYYNVYGAWRW